MILSRPVFATTAATATAQRPRGSERGPARTARSAGPIPGRCSRARLEGHTATGVTSGADALARIQQTVPRGAGGSRYAEGGVPVRR